MSDFDPPPLPEIDRQREPFFITPEEWYQFVLRAAFNRPQVSTSAAGGTSISHPWKVKVLWDLKEKKWALRFRSGSVRGLLVEQKEDMFISKWETIVEAGASSKLPLASAMAFLDIPTEVEESVKKQNSFPGLDRETMDELVERYFVWKEGEDATETRSLVMVKVYLFLLRPQVNLLAFENDQLPSFIYPDYEETPPFISIRQNMPPDLDGMQSLLDPFDWCLLANVFMLGPIGEPLSEVNESWTPIVQQKTWWNLDYAVNPHVAKIAPYRITNPLSGYGFNNVQNLINDLNARYAQAELHLFLDGLKNNRGRFFTI